MPSLTLAAVQAEPVVLDAKACLAKAVDLVRQAADQGGDLIVFPETFVPGYAHWTHSARFEDDALKAVHARLCENSVRVPEDLGSIADAAERARATVVLPVTEADPSTPGTPYNTMAVFGPDGGYLGKHRKLVPTHHERTAYGYGDGSTMRAFETRGPDGDAVRFGGLLCWNNYMPLARQALYAQGIQVHLAPTADDLESWQTAMRFIARESRCFVVGAGLVQRKSAFPEDFELSEDPAWQAENDWNERGGSVIVHPSGDVLAGPVFEEETIVTSEVDLGDVLAERQTFDPAGHYGRSDVLELQVEGLDPL